MSAVLSDGRYMVKAEPLEGALTKVQSLTVCSFEDTNGRRYALKGEEVLSLFPFAGFKDGVGMCYVDYEALVPVLVKAVQELAGKKVTKKKAAEAPAE